MIFLFHLPRHTGEAGRGSPSCILPRMTGEESLN